jgi:hypothetical protein
LCEVLDRNPHRREFDLLPSFHLLRSLQITTFRSLIPLDLHR